MERKRLLYWMVQFAGWTVYFLFSVLLLFSADQFSSTPNVYLYTGLLILSAIAISHGIRFIIIRKSLLSKQLLNLILITLVLAISAGFLLETFQYSIEQVIELDFLPEGPGEVEPFTWPSFLFGVSRSVILFLLWSGFYYVFAITEKSRNQEITNLKWKASTNEIELKNLRAQLNPHFLFNSLNSIRALVGLNPEQAKTSITHLSNLLRKSISLGKVRLIPLAEELELVRVYLELEKVRFEERLTIHYSLDEAALSAEIPPLMIQTIVENGIKHGISQQIAGGEIAISATKKKNCLKVLISNTGTYIHSEKSDGVGISNTQKRLAILFGEKATLAIQQVDKNVVVTINIEYA